jgi:hypothetical protein
MEKAIGVIAPKKAELHNSPDHKGFRAAFTKNAQEPNGMKLGESPFLIGS